MKLIVFLLLTTSCFAQTVHVDRSERRLGSGFHFSVFVDGHRAAKVRNGSAADIAVTPGRHEVCVEGHCLTVDVKDGETVRLRMEMLFGWTRHSATIEQEGQ